jgi:hypothetical protein
MSVLGVSILIIVKLLTNTSVSLVFANPLWRRQRIPAGSTYGTGVTTIAGVDRRDSNIAYDIIEFEQRILHNLADPNDENAYKSTTMLTDMTELMDRSFYEVAGVYEVIGVPELEPPVRIGNVYEYVVRVQVAVNP